LRHDVEEREKNAAQLDAIDRRTVQQSLSVGIRSIDALVRANPAQRSHRILLASLKSALATVRTPLDSDPKTVELLMAGRAPYSAEKHADIESVLSLYEESLALLPAEIATDQGAVSGLARAALEGRATALAQLGRFTESLLAFDEVVAMDERFKLPELVSSRVSRGLILRGAEVEQSRMPWSRPPRPDHAHAVRMAEALIAHKEVSPAALYNAACVYALASRDGKAETVERARRADQAVRLLRQSADQDYLRPAAPGMFSLFRREADTLNELQTDKDLDALRSREDFKTVVMDAVARAKGTSDTVKRKPAKRK
jgi:tetratricopeptide (TPR) repeat protein